MNYSIRGIGPIGTKSDDFMELWDLNWPEYIRVQKLIKTYQECDIELNIKNVVGYVKYVRSTGGNWHKRDKRYEPKLILHVID
jgi:hypothetical protein